MSGSASRCSRRTAPAIATKRLRHLERAVELDPKSGEGTRRARRFARSARPAPGRRSQHSRPLAICARTISRILDEDLRDDLPARGPARSAPSRCCARRFARTGATSGCARTTSAWPSRCRGTSTRRSRRSGARAASRARGCDLRLRALRPPGIRPGDRAVRAALLAGGEAKRGREGGSRTWQARAGRACWRTKLLQQEVSPVARAPRRRSPRRAWIPSAHWPARMRISAPACQRRRRTGRLRSAIGHCLGELPAIDPREDSAPRGERGIDRRRVRRARGSNRPRSKRAQHDQPNRRLRLAPAARATPSSRPAYGAHRGPHSSRWNHPPLIGRSTTRFWSRLPRRQGISELPL